MTHPAWEAYLENQEEYVVDLFMPNLVHWVRGSGLEDTKFQTLECVTCGRNTVSLTPSGPTCLMCFWKYWPRPADVEEMREVLEITRP